MPDKITFLGTGGGRISLADQSVPTGGFVLYLSGYQIMCDPGPGALIRARQYGLWPSKTDILFVSHKHLDHVHDVNAIVDAITFGGDKKKGVLVSVPSVVNGAADEQPWIHPYYKAALADVFVMRPKDKISFPNLDLIATPTIHDEEFGVGMRFETPKVKVGYTSDTIMFNELIDSFKGVNVMIINVLKPGVESYKTHMCTDDVVHLLERVQPDLAILTHFGLRMWKVNPQREAKEVQRRTGVRTLAAKEGMVVDLRG